MIFFMVLMCIEPPQSITIPKECLVIGANREHDQAVAMANRWCQGDPACEDLVYLQKLEVIPGYEKVK